MPATQIVGILNVTADSFSDGGRYLSPETAIAHARELVSAGADLIDIGAQSSRPGAHHVTVQEELERIEPVIQALKREKIRVSVDTYKPEVMRRAAALGVDMINDITALRDPASVGVVKEAGLPVVIMHAKSEGPEADRVVRDPRRLMDKIMDFFDERIGTLTAQGIALEKIIIDPGMGFFLAANPEPSLVVLKHIQALKRFGARIYLSTSRKSFIGSILHRDVAHRAAGTLATELWAHLQGVDFIRTHEVGPLRDAIRMIQAIQAME